MGDETVKIVKLSELVGSSRPVTGAYSIISSPSVSLSESTRNFGARNGPDRGSHPGTAIPDPKVLKSFKAPVLLTGTLTLPPHNDDLASECNCFKFSDGSATICCDILQFDLKIIGQRIRILAWNFIPLRRNGGFLEIIRWDFLEPSSVFSTFSLFSGSSTNCTDLAKARPCLTGAVESVSPVSVVPCISSSTRESNVSRSRGFLAKMLVCECKLCSCTYSTIQLHNSKEHTSNHCFNKAVIVYFCGPASVWHPVITRLVGSIVSLLGLKKKLAYIMKETSQLVYVTVEKSLMRLSYLQDQFIQVQKTDIRGNGECGSYSGIVTGIYMQGMIVELDQEVMLMLTDHDITVPHGLRVGAIASVKNVHFVNPRFSWEKFLILGSCIKTSISVKSFSSLETGCYTKSQHQSLLSKFIDSLTFVARLWVLLLIASFKRKFSGILSMKEILGSKNKEGLAQLYARSRLPVSAFFPQRGIFKEFCEHDRCACGSEVNYFHSSLLFHGHHFQVVPFSNLISYCESIWMKMWSDQERDYDIMGWKDQCNSISCGSRDHVQLIRRTVHSDEIGIALVGRLKISASSGRLQLVDATGNIDVIPDISLNWNFKRLYEVKKFTLIMEGMPEKMDRINLLQNEPFTCRRIFTSGPFIREINMSLHLSYNVADKISIDHPVSDCINMKETFQELESGKFHLLWIKHKFPILQKYHHQSISSNSSVFAEALVLPWDLHIGENNGDALSAPFSDLLKDSVECLTRGLPPCKKGKIGHPSRKYCNFSILSEVPCLVTGRRVNSDCIGRLQCNNVGVKCGCSEHEIRKALLEFSFEAFSIYEAMKIGCYYIIEHHNEDMLCTSPDGGKVLLNSRNHIWSLSFSTDEILQNSNSSFIFPQGSSIVNDNEVSPEGYHQQQIPPSEPHSLSTEIHTDVNLFLSSAFISLLEDKFKLPKVGLIDPLASSEEETETNYCSGTMVTPLMQPHGTRYSDHHLPKGDLISLCGRVQAIHYLDEKSLPVPLRCEVHSGAHSMFFEEKSFCVHLMVDQKMVRIYGASHKHACPAGFGKGVTATFHRILVLSGQDSFMLIPASFISVHSRSEIYDVFDDMSHYAPADAESLSVASSSNVPKALIYEMMHCSKTKPLQLRGRVVAVYALILENKDAINSWQRIKSKSSSSLINIPLAGFVLDDGSSSCCCWANCERAAAFLGLHSKEHCKACEKSSWSSRKRRKDKSCSSIGCRLNKVIKRLGRVVVKNHGSTSDPSLQDLMFAVNSDEIISSSDEDFLRSLILRACSSTSLNVVASLMNSEATNALKQHLTGLDMVMPQVKNVWALGVDHIEPLAEARNIIQELVENT
ncbi:PREDICTED: CST complex subunit CTC1 isoform X2 [Ipomoea nil]|uniref:CST complex subunit CTC1 isoform X2 n=1 Tax=Ipomoea nil TaxID=35883 RepID=UPI00090168F1|nr:PREDICTED: CST complex subunit CTC1 isoform X2 [Ipomoea nil]